MGLLEFFKLKLCSNKNIEDKNKETIVKRNIGYKKVYDIKSRPESQLFLMTKENSPRQKIISECEENERRKEKHRREYNFNTQIP